MPMTPEEARAFHRSILVVDETAPLLGAIPETFRLWKEGGATAVAPTIALNHGVAETIARIGVWLRFIDAHADELLLIREASDLERAHREDLLGIVFHFQNSVPVGQDLNMVTVYHDLGVRMIQLAYNQKNFVGDGCEERTNAGLSRFGLELVAEMNRLGIIIDLSHTGHRTTLEAAEASRAPVMFSHANPRAVHHNPRNILDDQIEAVARSNGLIGIVGYPAFVSASRSPKVADLLPHVEYLVDLVGIDHVGVGIDYFEKMAGFAADEDAKAWYEGALRSGQWSSESYPPPPWHYPAEIAGPSTLHELTVGLLDHGFGEEDVRKVMGGNFARVFGEVRALGRGR